MKNKISKKFMRITSYTLIIITMITIIAIIVISKWISRDDYVPKKLGNSVSAALNNRYGSSCSIVENDKYIFYVNRVKDSFPLIRIDKDSGEKKLLKKYIGDSDGSALFIYKNTLIYTKSKDLGYTNRYYDIYSCDFDGKNEKLIKKESPVPHMVIDDYIYDDLVQSNYETNEKIDEYGKVVEYDEVTLVDRIIDVYMDTREVNIGILANKIIEDNLYEE